MEERQKKNDRKLVVILLVLAALLFGITLIRRYTAQRSDRALEGQEEAGTKHKNSGPVAVVKLDGREVLRLSIGTEDDAGESSILFLDETYVSEAEDGSFCVYAKGSKDPEGGLNVLRAEDGSISCTEADCPDQVCVRTGAISLETDTIVCLPHRMIVTILSADAS